MLDLRDSGGTIATTTVAYVAGGAIPALAVAGTSLTYDTMVKRKEDLSDVDNPYQATVVLGKEVVSWTIIGFIAFLICATYCRKWLKDMLKFLKNMFK